MKRTFASLAISVLLVYPMHAASADTQFADDACPQANASGRTLNSLNAGGKATNDQIMTAAQGLVDAYKDCASAFDATSRMKNNDGQSTDYIVVHRAYARLQLARSLQRIGSLHEQLKETDKARAAYQAAMQPLDELDAVIGTQDISSNGSEGKILAEGRDLRAALKTSLAGLPAGSPPAPSPVPSAT